MKLTRHQLHARVWEKPMIQLAREFGLSDVGLAKICRKHGIPLPERGYWAKVEAGYNPSKKSLPRKDYDPEIEIVDRSPITEEVLQEKKEQKEKQAQVIASVGTSSVPTELSSPHKLTIMTLHYYQDIQKKLDRDSKVKLPFHLDWQNRAPSAEYGRYWCSPENGFDLKVSLERLNRALCFLDTLVKALEQHGFKIQNDVEGRRGKKAVEAVKDGEGVRFHLNEGYKQRLLTAQELKAARAERSYASEFDRAPSGIFTLSVAGRDEWYDKKYVDSSKKIEEHFSAIIAEFVDLVPRQKQARIDKAKAEAEARERERIRELARHKRREQQKQFDDALEEAKKLESLERLEAYLQRLEEGYRAEFGEVAGNVAEWLHVVRSIARSNNPLENRLEYFRGLREYDPSRVDWMPDEPDPAEE